MFLKNRNISSKIKRSKVTDYAASILYYSIYKIWKKHAAVLYFIEKSIIFVKLCSHMNRSDTMRLESQRKWLSLRYIVYTSSL